MTISVRQLHPLFVGEVRGVDMREPPDAAPMADIVAAARVRLYPSLARRRFGAVG
jgi:hypothetical protein